MRAQSLVHTVCMLCMLQSCTKPPQPADSDVISTQAGDSDNRDSGTRDDTASDTNTPVSTEPCTQWSDPEDRATVADASLDEISGLVASRAHPGVFWVHEDSGAGPILTAINGEGATHSTLTLTDVSSVDWEDMAIAPCGAVDCLWVGDFGDNGSSRSDVQLLRVEEPDLSEVEGNVVSSATSIPFSYPDGPQDAEALVVDAEGQPYVLTKRTDATTHIYRVPVDGTEVATRVATVSTGDLEGLSTATTAADLWPDGSRLLIRGYLKTIELDISETGIDAAHLAPQAHVITGVDLQGEAMAYDPAGPSIWHVSEGLNPTLWTIDCAE